MPRMACGLERLTGNEIKRRKIGDLALIACAAELLAACSDGHDAGKPCSGAEAPTVRLFLQQLTSSSVIIKWCGDATAACLGSAQDRLNMYVEATNAQGDHKEALFTGPSPQSTYYYSVGGAAAAPGDQYFTTAPNSDELPDDGNMRIWLIGDSGTGGDDEREDQEGEAAEVLAGMRQFVANDGQEIDLFLMLGDNAYTSGTDTNYQQAVFETSPALLKTHSLWPTIGNHEMGFLVSQPHLTSIVTLCGQVMNL